MIRPFGEIPPFLLGANNLYAASDMRVLPALARVILDIFPNQTHLGGVLHYTNSSPQGPKTGENIMANTPQSKKRALQNEKRYAVNKARRSRIRTYLRKVEEAIASGDQTAAAAALKAAQPELMRGVTKGVFHKNTAARKMSRLSSRVKAMA
jgi:small subunit ribosomal protein S20